MLPKYNSVKFRTLESCLSGSTTKRQLAISTAHAQHLNFVSLKALRAPSSYPRSLDREMSGLGNSENIGLPVELRMPSFQKWNEKILGHFRLFLLFSTNKNRSCNGTFESCSFRQACAARNEDSRYEVRASYVSIESKERAETVFNQLTAKGKCHNL